MSNGNIDQVITYNKRRNDGNQQTHVETDGRKGFLFPHKTACDKRFPQPTPFPAHLLFQEYIIIVGNNCITDGRILIISAIMTQDQVRHSSVIAKGGPLPQEFLVQPFIQVFQDQVFPVAGQRPRQTADCIEHAFRCLHDAKCNVIPNRLHLCQRIRIGVSYVRPPGHAAYLLIFKRLDDIDHRIRIQEAVRIYKDQQFMLRMLGAYRHRLALSLVDRLQDIADACRHFRAFLVNDVLDRFLYHLGRMIGGTVIHNDNL